MSREKEQSELNQAVSDEISTESGRKLRSPMSQNNILAHTTPFERIQVRGGDRSGPIGALHGSGKGRIVRFEDLGLWGLPEGAEYAD